MNSKISVKFNREFTHSGENKCTSIEITLPNDLLNYWVYIDFMKPDETKFKTPKLDIVDNKAIYDLPSNLLDQNGIIKAQVVLENEDGVIYKSSIIKRKVYESINASDDIPDQEDFVSVVQASLDRMEIFKSEIEKGLNPSIGDNGNWFVSGIDTGKPSRGKDGTDGENYVITDDDYVNIGNIVEINLQPIINTIQNNSQTAVEIAKGANQSLSYQNYSEMISTLNELTNDVYNVGQNVLIVTLDVPDLWISEIMPDSIPYTYVSDNNFISELKENSEVQIGYYKLSALETQKVDLTEYATKGELDQQIGNVASVLDLINGEVI
jgi:hypothetical protein